MSTRPLSTDEKALRVARGAILKQHRERAGISATALANKVRETFPESRAKETQRIYSFELGRTLLEEEDAACIAKVLSIDPSELLTVTPSEIAAPAVSPEAIQGAVAASSSFLLSVAEQACTQLETIHLELKLEVLPEQKKRRFIEALDRVASHLRSVTNNPFLHNCVAEEPVVFGLLATLNDAEERATWVHKNIAKLNVDTAAFRNCGSHLEAVLPLLRMSIDHCTEWFRSASETLFPSNLTRHTGRSQSLARKVHVERVSKLLEDLKQEVQRFSECASTLGTKDAKLKWEKLGDVGWKICDLAQQIHFQLADLLPPDEAQCRDAVQTMMDFARFGSQAFLTDEVDPDVLFRLRVSGAHVEQRIPRVQQFLSAIKPPETELDS